MRSLAIALAGLLLHSAAMAGDVTVFAAASMTEALEKIAGQFKSETGLTPSLSFAGSSVLARQIRRGAPADVMVSANRAWMEHLVEGNALSEGDRKIIAGNRLVLIARAEDETAATSLESALRDQDARIAVGDPDHVPVGIYARQALSKLGLWDLVGNRITPSGSTRSALAFVQRGATRYGIVYRTDALAFPDVKIVAVIPPETHDPISYETAVTFQGKALNKKNSLLFFSYLTSPAASRILSDAGFQPCKVGGC